MSLDTCRTASHDRKRSARATLHAAIVVVLSALAAACTGGGNVQTPDVRDSSANDTISDASDALSDDGARLPDVVIDSGADVPDSASARDASDAAPPQRPVWDIRSTERTGCMFGPGDLTTRTIGPAVPHGSMLPFDKIVVLMLENRSFDHYFSRLPAVGVTDVDVASPTASNPDPGPPVRNVQRFHETRYCIDDTAHNWDQVHLQWDSGRMDGFVAASNPGGARAMGYYDERDLAYYYWLARTFSISDRHFSSMLGPTWPNRFYFYGATSWGRTRTPDSPALNRPKITNLLENAGRTWRIYRDGATSFAIVFGTGFAGSAMTRFDSDVAANTLPDLSIIDPNFMGGSQNDEHPPSNIQLGQRFTARVVSTLMRNPAVWRRTVLLITYDEHGGLYDHVPPPPACEPDGDRPPDFAFDRLGVRIPLMVVSPFARAGYVSHLVTDLTSLTRFIENRFDLPAMTRRDANAWPMLDMFDFASAPHVTPPMGAPLAEPFQAQVDWCANNPPGTGMP